jgi:archaellum component FlaF (FlaF/FlaG flagellin family)
MIITVISTFKEMNFNKKTKRGLSNIVTGAILLSAVAVMGVVIVGWSNTNLAKHQAELDSTLSNNFNKVNENMLIEHIWFSSTGPSMNITMNNIGTVGLNVTGINIKNINSLATSSFAHKNGGIVPGGTLSLKETFSWTTKTPYEVTVTTGRDSQFKTQVLSP